ncbi:flagellar export chaperone FliS [Paenibacillus sp. PAMC21692]|uniref:flagellar export chaperone FliS n=1 Tax=Paenibacillus sp. PAMC21692 TaxID=2762320 RepID=UPI00164E425D|nr:flagellar export chaperone FliS [Paenibacillus sp. PAMC21692]QNK58361.1 flagellar export chaperone FliS [Paenibacillus sp. PAMC21692]
MIPNSQGYRAYQNNKYTTASPHRLITMLYDGVLRFTSQAGKALNSKEYELANQSLKRSQDILYELISCLNMKDGGQIAENLRNLYLYAIDLTIKANVQKNSSYLSEVISIITELKGAWEQIGKEVSVNHV